MRNIAKWSGQKQPQNLSNILTSELVHWKSRAEITLAFKSHTEKEKKKKSGELLLGLNYLVP